jgi:hypothetical protein
MSISTEGIGTVLIEGTGIVQRATVALGLTYEACRLFCSMYLQITGSSQEGKDTSLTGSYTGTGELGKERDTGNTITGGDRNTNTMD